MSIKVKLGAIFILLFALFIMGVSLFIWNSNNKMLDTSIEDKMNVTVQSVESILEEKAKQALAIGMTVSHIPEIVEAAENQNREEAIERMVPIYESLKDDFYLSVLHLRSPYDTSLVRAQNLESYGDTTTREAIVDTGTNNQFQYGFDQGPFGIGMRGWIPMTSNDEVIGTMEANIEFTEELLQEIKEILGVDLVVYVPEDGEEENDEEGKMNLLSGTIDMENLIDEQLLSQAEDRQSDIVRDGDIAYTLFPIKSYEGETLTIMGAIQDISHYRSMIMGETKSLIISLLVLGILITLMIMLFLHRTLKPMKQMMSTANQAAHGDLRQNIHIDSKDEMGQLAQAMNEMTSNTRALIRDAAGISEQVTSYSEELMTSTNEMRDGIEQVSATTEVLASGSTDQAQHASETLEKIQQVDHEVKQINQHTQEMTNRSQITEDSSQRGIQSAEQSIQQMKMIEEKVSSTVHIVKELGEKSIEINQILEVINDIAAQTNLLALNAAIEAARAGEHGKGFAVVADEVRQLAEQSAQSTNQISNIIETVQKEAQEAEQAMNGVVQEVQSGSEVIGSNRQAFDEIAQNITDMVRQINKVTDVSKLIDRETNEAVKAVENIAAISQESSAGSEELSATMEQQNASMQEINRMADNLAQMAESLNQSLLKFKYE